MSFAHVTVTTDASGDATAYTSETYNGRIINVVYTKTDFADGVDFTITTETTGQNVWVQSNVNASATVAPRQATHDTVGAASLYAAAGEPVEDYVYLVQERLQIVVAQGGNAKTGAFRLIVA
jgi:hypothetical protein